MLKIDSDCRENLKMVILAIWHVIKSAIYEPQNDKFRVSRQSQQKHATQH